jgi:hypothetical protein
VGCLPRDSKAVVLAEGLGSFAFSFCWLIGWDAFLVDFRDWSIFGW